MTQVSLPQTAQESSFEPFGVEFEDLEHLSQSPMRVNVFNAQIGY